MSVHRSLAFLFLGLVSAAAQVPAEAPPGVPVPGQAPQPAAGAPANALPRLDLALKDTKIVEPIEELKLSGDALAGLYRKYTGRRVIVSTPASTAEFRFVQDASEQDPLTFGEAADLLRKAAILEGFVFVPDHHNPNLDVLMLSPGGVPGPRPLGLPVYNENDMLPETDAVISYVMTLSYIKPAEAVNTFTQIIGQFGAFGSIAAVPNAAAVVITENTSLIRKLIDLKAEIDKPSSQVGTRFITVKYADVTEIAATLTDLLTAQQSAQTTAGIQRADATPAPAPAVEGAPAVPGQPGGSSGESTPVQIIPDPRTNRIFAMGRPVDLIFVEGLVREFDVETSEKNFLRRKLRFLTVSDFLPIAGDALNRAFTGTGDSGGTQASGGGGGAGGQTASRTQQTSRQSSSRNTGTSSGANFGGGGSGAGNGSLGGGGGGSSLSEPSVSSAPESVLVGRTLLVADNITNSIVVQGPPSGLEIIERLLDQIDVKPDQVMISTIIGQLALRDNFTMGLDYLRLGNDFVGRGGSGRGPILPILRTGGTGENAGPFNPGNLSGGGLQLYGKIGNNLRVYLDALQSKGDFTVLSRPSIFTSNNQKGIISSGERIAIPTSSNNFSAGGSSTNIEYQDVVLKLEIIPLVNSENEITMQVALLNDERGADQVIEGAGSGGAPLTVPGITTREILTTVTVPNNETVVLGGLIISRKNSSRSGIPILGSIPYVGALFSRTVEDKDRSELMVFIQPSIVSNDRSLNSVQADMDARYKASPNIRDFADGPGVLPPVDVILPVDDKVGAYPRTTTRSAVAAPRVTPTTSKPSMRPIHRR
ncbi:MAG: secretin N-terminal domain-containing protein [Akkermansiaceae bacterium]